MSFQYSFYSSKLNQEIQRLEQGHLESLPQIFCVFAEDVPAQKLQAANCLSHFLKQQTLSSISKIDSQMRQTTSIEWWVDWKEFQIEQFFTNQMNVQEKRAITIFSSFHPNGYIRQQALKQLGQFEFTLPYLLLRQNDWVWQVRHTASEETERKLSTGCSDEEILEALPIVAKLRRSQRCDYKHFLSSFLQQLSNRPHLLTQGLQHRDPITRKLCLHLLMETDHLCPETLIPYLIHEPEPFLRKQYFLALQQSNADLSEMIPLFLKDKYPANCLLALQFLYENNRPAALIQAQNMLLHKNALLREQSRKIVAEQIPSFDFQIFYRHALKNHPLPAILGLGEVGNRQDCALILPYLQHQQVSHIRAAMISLMWLDAKTFSPTVTQLLTSSFCGIIKTAKQLLEKYQVQNFQQIFEIYQQTNSENTALKCTALLVGADKWNRLFYLLQTLDSQFPSVQQLSLSKIQIWILRFNRSFMLPSEQQVEQLTQLIHQKKALLGATLQQSLLFSMKKRIT